MAAWYSIAQMCYVLFTPVCTHLSGFQYLAIANDIEMNNLGISVLLQFTFSTGS
jgi:hypothetical protein